MEERKTMKVERLGFFLAEVKARGINFVKKSPMVSQRDYARPVDVITAFDPKDNTVIRTEVSAQVQLYLNEILCHYSLQVMPGCWDNANEELTDGFTEQLKFVQGCLDSYNNFALSSLPVDPEAKS